MCLNISEIQIIPLKPSGGLVGFASCVVNNQFYVGNIAILTSPKTRTGFRLQFPTKKLASGKQVDCFYPISKEVEEFVSEKIISEYLKLMDNFNHIE